MKLGNYLLDQERFHNSKCLYKNKKKNLKISFMQDIVMLVKLT